tara:strand:- start:835 stop:951 length:117 start_codon:yes stop_codon:yes gene_type:complete
LKKVIAASKQAAAKGAGMITIIISDGKEENAVRAIEKV